MFSYGLARPMFRRSATYFIAQYPVAYPDEPT